MATSRLSAAVVGLLATIVAFGLILPPAAVAHDPEELDRFVRAIGRVESGGRYTARNASSGAYGKYQIMPSSWRAWARLYLGRANAAPTPANQEIVARAKIHALHHWLGDWGTVAHWWLTGSSERNPARWSAYSKRYVKKVMALFDAAPAAPAVPGTVVTAVTVRSYQEGHTSIAWTGGWRQAPYLAYAGRNASWTNETGATATFTFTGRTVTWFGPSGPTRGTALVFVDDVHVQTVDLYASRFRPKTRIFSTTFAEAAPHTLRIEVAPTKGRSTVAIDQFIVTD